VFGASDLGRYSVGSQKSQVEIPLRNNEGSGHVALVRYSDAWTYCSGVLMTNNKVLTAKHCVDDWVAGESYVKMGSQYAWITAVSLKSDFDVAMLKLAPALSMNGSTTGYSRPIYSGTNASLNSTTTYCSGHGPGGAGFPPLRWGYFNTTFADGYNPSTELHIWKNGAGQLPQGGDSGAGCATFVGPDGPVTMIQSGCFYSPLYMCYGPGAESWRAWAQFLIVLW